MGFEKKLAKMKKQFKEAASQDIKGLGEVGNCKCEAVIISAELVESKSSGKLQIKRVHELTSGDFAGKKVYDYMQLQGSEYSLTYIRAWIEQLGFDFDEDPKAILKVLKKITKSAIACVIRVVVDEDKGFTNVRLLKTIGSEEESPESAEEEEEEEEEDTDSNEEEEEEEETEEEETEEEEEEEEEGTDFSSMSRKELKGYIKENELDVTVFKKYSDEDIIEKIKEAENSENSEEEEEEEESKDDSDGTPSDINEDLLNFCVTNDIDLEEDAKDKEMIKAIKKAAPFKTDDLEPDEISVLEANGLGNLIKSKKKKTTTKKSTKKTVKKKGKVKK